MILDQAKTRKMRGREADFAAVAFKWQIFPSFKRFIVVGHLDHFVRRCCIRDCDIHQRRELALAIQLEIIIVDAAVRLAFRVFSAAGQA